MHTRIMRECTYIIIDIIEKIKYFHKKKEGKMKEIHICRPFLQDNFFFFQNLGGKDGDSCQIDNVCPIFCVRFRKDEGFFMDDTPSLFYQRL